MISLTVRSIGRTARKTKSYAFAITFAREKYLTFFEKVLEYLAHS